MRIYIIMYTTNCRQMRMNAIRFEWDGRKEKAYIEKHGVSFDEEKEYWRQGDSIIYKI